MMASSDRYTGGSIFLAEMQRTSDVLQTANVGFELIPAEYPEEPGFVAER